MMCENCGGDGAIKFVLYEGEEEQTLCHKCIKLLRQLEKEYGEIIGDNNVP